jgi:hypothetical protein
MNQQQISRTPARLARPVPASTAVRSLDVVQDTGLLERSLPAQGKRVTSVSSSGRATPAASLLFAPGDRSGVDQVRALAAADRSFLITFDPEEDARSGASDPGRRWLEVSVNGLAFDLTGLAPREQAPLPEAGHLFGLASDFPQRPLEALTLVPGPGLAGRRQMLPVMRSHALLTARLAALPGVAAVAWHGARAWSAPGYFRAGVMRWMEGGAFPGLGLAGLSATPDGGMASEGLALFTGQEVLLAPSIAENRAQGARIALRIMHWLVENGRVSEPGTLQTDSGISLQIEPSSNGRLIKVRKT